MEAIDALNFHMKPGAGYPMSMEATMRTYLANIRAILKPADLARLDAGTLPLFDGETSYSPTGFVDSGTCPGGPGCYTDPDMAASFVARLSLYNWSVGVTATNWYTWDQMKSQTKAVGALKTMVDWMVGATMTKPCAPVGADPGVYTCELTRGGSVEEVIWDNSLVCSNGSCSTTMQTVPNGYSTYADIEGGAPVSIANHKVAVGIKPLLLKP